MVPALVAEDGSLARGAGWFLRSRRAGIILPYNGALDKIIKSDNNTIADTIIWRGPMERIDLILHPVRFRILESLAGETLTTQEIAERLADVPKSSIYRHLRRLLEGGMVAVAGERPVRGVVEKTYRLDRPLFLGADEMSGVTAEDHVRYFRAYAMTLIQGYATYVRAASEATLDMAGDRAGYTEVFLHATDDEFDRFGVALNESLRLLLENPPGGGRRKRKLAVITHPER